MNIQLPELFLERMRKLLPSERYEAFLRSYQQPYTRSLRLNSLKVSPDVFEHLKPQGVHKTSSDLVYLDESQSLLGVTPFHHAGLFYLQEPSAALVCDALSIAPGDRIIDLCAAPGGKSVQLLSRLNHTGFLVANEISAQRNRILQSNLERWGADNYAVTQTSTPTLAKTWPNTFNHVVVDAPCSGESLYRRHPHLLKAVQDNNPVKLAELQRSILEDAYQLCQNHGTILYSTCTFNTIENEEVLEHFLDAHPECSLAKVRLPYSVEGYGSLGPFVSRYFPMDFGEGHFIACIQVSKPERPSLLEIQRSKQARLLAAGLNLDASWSIHKEGNRCLASLQGILSEKPWLIHQGVILLEGKGQRFIPAHQAALSCHFASLFPQILEVSESEAYQFLNGQVLSCAAQGWTRVTYHGYSLGFGKCSEHRLNNYYPKGLRNLKEFYE